MLTCTQKMDGESATPEMTTERDEYTATDAKGIFGGKKTVHKEKSKDSKAKDGYFDERIPRYRMDYPTTSERGHAVIFNNEKFHWMTGMSDRTGTDADEKNLVRLFNKLDFMVSSYKNVTKTNMMKIAQEKADADHSQYDCFLMVFLSHGDDGVIYGTDGTLEIKSIVDLFHGKVCPSLAGKPKIFIFQACRGNKHEDPVKEAGDVVDGADVVDGVHVEALEAGVKPTIPNASDFLFCYSVIEGFYSHRDTLYGSWYIQAFVEVFEEELINRGHGSAMQFDVLDLLTLVHHKVSRRSVERTKNPDALGKKQMPCFLSMLTKKLFLAPKQSGKSQ